MALTPEQVFQIRVPQIVADGTEYPKLQAYIPYSEQITDETAFSIDYGMAVALRCLHYYTLDKFVQGGQSVGNIKKKKEDKLEIEYFDSSSSSGNSGTTVDREDLRQTKWGKELLELASMNIMNPHTVNSL